MVRKILIGLVVVALLLVGGVAILPFVVDVNKFRPSIVSAVESKMNAKVELGKLQLHVLKGLGLSIEGFSLTPTAGKAAKQTTGAVFDVKKLDVLIPWHRVLFSPILNVSIQAPTIRVIQYRDGSMNLMDLVKTEAASTGTTAPPTSTGATKAPGTSEAPSALPGIVQRAAINIALKNGVIHYVNADGQKMDLQPLNMELRNISLTKEMTLLAEVDLSVQSEKPKMEMIGRLKKEFRLSPQVDAGGTKLEKLTINGSIDLSDLGFYFRPAFRKKRGERLALAMEAIYTPASFQLKHLGMKMGQSSVSLHGDVGLQNAANPTLNLALDIDPLHLKEATTWISGVGDAEGTVRMKMNATGTLQHPNINLTLRVDGKNLNPEGVQGTISELKTQLDLKAQASKTAEGYKPKSMALEMPEFLIAMGALNLKGSMTLKGTDQAADMNLKVFSNEFNLDALTGGPQAANAGGSSGSSATTSGTGGGAAAANAIPLPDRLKALDAQLRDLKKISMLRGSRGKVDVRFNKLIASGLQIEKFVLDASANQLDFKLNELSLGTFGGKIGANGGLNLRGQQPVFAGTFKVSNIDLESATKYSAPSLSGLVDGKLEANGKMNTQGILWENLKSDLTGSGEFQIKDGRLSTLPVGKWVAEAVSRAKVLNKFSGDVQKSAGKDYGDKIKVLVAKATVAKGVATLKPVTLEYATGDIGFDGTGTADFDQNLNFEGNAKAAASVVPVNELKGADGRSWIPLRFGGTLAAPKVDYAYTVQEVTKRVAKGKAQALVKEQAQKILEREEVKKVIEQPKVQEGLKNILKKGKLF